jgi:hypothetical protein
MFIRRLSLDLYLVARGPLRGGYRLPGRLRFAHALISMPSAPFRILFASAAFVAVASVLAAAEPCNQFNFS